MLNPINTRSVFGEIPEKVDFIAEFEPTKVAHKKYVINSVTGEYLDTVGHKFNCASHPFFFRGVQNVMIENLDARDMEGVQPIFRTARNNAWVMMDVTFPNVKVDIETSKHMTQVSYRVIALHGIDGSCSNQVYFGNIDSFCTNGDIAGEYDSIKRKNTSQFSLTAFIDELRRSKQDFYEHGRKLQTWAETYVSRDQVKLLLDDIIKSTKKADKMMNVYNMEVSNRGENLFSLYSAFTNYSSHSNDLNGFRLRDTGNDTQAQSMFNREQEVSRWVSSQQFKEFVDINLNLATV